MLNWLWMVLLVGGVAASAAAGHPEVTTAAAAESARSAVDYLIGLAAVLILWMGLNRIAERAGLTEALGKAICPLVAPLFPGVPRKHPAMASILLNVSANLLGLGNAATPFGLKAMEELQKLNSQKDVATPAMCTLLALNTASITLVPSTIIALRAAAGSRNPAEVLVPTLLATAAGSAAALLIDYHLRRRYLGRGREQ